MSNEKIADLKAKFVTGAIPQESDYATLLNMLEETRAATGTSPEAPKSASLKLSDEGYLDVAVAADGGLVTGASGLSTDARVVWARNHAIATGASQYGMWSGGYTFIYRLDEAGSKKLVVCAETQHPNITGVCSYKFLSQDGKNAVFEKYQNGEYETIPGWTDRFGTFANTGKHSSFAFHL